MAVGFAVSGGRDQSLQIRGLLWCVTPSEKPEAVGHVRSLSLQNEPSPNGGGIRDEIVALISTVSPSR